MTLITAAQRQEFLESSRAQCDYMGIVSTAVRPGVKSAIVAIWGLAACTVYISANAEDVPERIVREQRTVIVQGVQEEWQLVWEGKPSTVCGAGEVSVAITCPCYGFAYGEYGKLLLIRNRGGREIDRMDLRPLFGKFDYPDAKKLPGTAYLQRWPLMSDDAARELRNDSALVSEIEHRSPTAIMHFADYDQDGSATEFLLEVGTLPCMKPQFAAIGVSAHNRRLHAFATVDKPGDPLIMPPQAWSALLTAPDKRPVQVWQCDDHGSEVRSELIVSAKSGNIHVTGRDFSCPSDESFPGELVAERIY
jgi:hypothetical protein